MTDGPNGSGDSTGSTLMETTLSFLRRKKDDGDNVRVLLLLPVLDLDAGECGVFAAVVVVVVVVGDVFLVRKLILDLVNGLVVGVVTTIGAVVSGESELDVSVQFDKSGSLNGRKEDRNVCMCVVVVD